MATEFSLEDALCEPSAMSRPLCVALDGTVIATRVVSEQVALLFRQRPWSVLALPLWALREGGLGRGLARATRLDPVSLPYRIELIAALRLCRESGRRVVLAADTDLEVAEQ